MDQQPHSPYRTRGAGEQPLEEARAAADAEQAAHPVPGRGRADEGQRILGGPQPQQQRVVVPGARRQRPPPVLCKNSKHCPFTNYVTLLGVQVSGWTHRYLICARWYFLLSSRSKKYRARMN